jgi:signal transduction histidine kinase
MRSLFLKIFLLFWLTQVLISVALIIVFSLQPELVVSRWRASTGDAVAMYAQSAAEEVDRYGVTSLKNFFQRLDSTGHIRAALLDEQLQLVAGNMPPAALDLAREARHTGQREYEVHSGTAYAALRISGPSGRTYVFVAQMSRGPYGAFRPSVSWRWLRWSLSIVISGLICYLLTLYLTRPILRLRRATHQLAEGNLGARASAEMERRRDELGGLVRDFNVMAERIEAALTSQQQLIRDISHELRSPLARLNVALGLARQKAGDQATAQLDRIEREAERLNEMIGQLLSLARMQGAAGPPEKTPVQLDALVREVADDASFEAQERHCTVHLQSMPACTVQGSPQLLRSAVENVVRNAVRYTAEGTPIEIAVSSNDSMAVVTVRDHGPGVPDAELGRLFRPFYRVATARERNSGGTGLGLAITERAVRLHGGTVHAANAPDGGLLVTIQVPAQCETVDD